LTFIIQGFGAVGAHAAKLLCERIPLSKVIGVSDKEGFIYGCDGLPIPHLFKLWQKHGLVSKRFYEEELREDQLESNECKFGTDPNDLLRESAFCLIPAAPIANYLDTDSSTSPSMMVDRMGSWNLIVEGANTYSPDPDRRHSRARMERSVYRQKGVLIATDYLVNSGGVIYAAQERLIKTPDKLRFPEAILGDRDEVEKWLKTHQLELEDLAEKRRIAGEKNRDEVIKRNMHELIEMLLSDADMLPLEAADRISVQRIAKSESARTAADIMTPIPTLGVSGTLREAAECLVQTESPILAVVTSEKEMAGVITRWDITQATAMGYSKDVPLKEIMTEKVISARPDDGLLTIVRNLEQHEFSAMPVVDDGQVLGMVCTDILTRTSLLRLLQTQIQ
jgi:glutamate dehydrogenase (NAD(P)+)